MTFTTETLEPTKPRWVVSFPGDVPFEVVKRIREQMGDPEDVRTIVLTHGGMLYDARQGPPITELEATAEVVERGPWWMLYLAVLLNAVAVVGLCLILAFWK